MPPKKTSLSLFKISIKNCFKLMNSTCFNIEKCNNENAKKELMFMRLQEYLFSKLSGQYFDLLWEERSCEKLEADRRFQILLLAHPNMSILRKLDQDSCVSQYFWMDLLVNLTKLTVLDLNLVCRDEILTVVGQNCLLLEELNMTSAAQFASNAKDVGCVSDAGLSSIFSLKHLRILFMDAPGHFNNGHSLTQNGIRRLLQQLPELEELNIKSDCGMGSTLFKSALVSKPLGLKRINCGTATVTVEGIKRLMSWCPNVKEFHCSRLCKIGKDEIIQLISESELELTKLELPFLSFNNTFSQLLKLKGERLTDLSLTAPNTPDNYIQGRVDMTMSFDTVLLIGECCPKLKSLKLITKGNPFSISHTYFNRKLYRNLHSLTIDCNNMEAMLIFFADCSLGLRNITVSGYRRINLDRCMTQLLKAGHLSELIYLDLLPAKPLADTVLWNILRRCDNLQTLKINFSSLKDLTDVQNYIRDNNLDLILETRARTPQTHLFRYYLQ